MGKKLDVNSLATIMSLDRGDQDVIHSNELIVNGNNLTEQIIAETDPAKLEDLTTLFKINQKKKDLVRINKLSNLLEYVDDEVALRLACAPEIFDNDQLLNYMRSTQSTITELENSLEGPSPLIQINNQKNEINISQDSSGLDLASRKKVLDVVKSIINSTEEIIDVEVEEVE